MSEQIEQSPEVQQALATGLITAADLAAAVVAGINAAQGPKKIGIARYIRERSKHRGKPFLSRKTMQNGYPVTEDSLSADAITMFNSLRPGIYCEGTFVVVPAKDGNSMNGVDLQYNNKTPDQRYAISGKYGSIERMLAAILKEQEAASLAK